MFPHLHTPALEGCWKLGEAEMKAKLLWGVLSAPPYPPPALPGSSELGGCGRVLSWSLTLEAPTPGKGRRRRQGGHQSALDWRSHQTCVKDSWSGRRAWEVALGGGEIPSLVTHLPGSPATEVGVFHPPYTWRGRGLWGQNGLPSHPQLVERVLCSKFTAMSPPITPLGTTSACRTGSEKNALIFLLKLGIKTMAPRCHIQN